MSFKIGILHMPGGADDGVDVTFHVACGLVSIDTSTEEPLYLSAGQWRRLVETIQSTTFEALTHETTCFEKAEHKKAEAAAKKAERTAEDARLAALGLVRWPTGPKGE